ncbi:MAG TPA: hypothetical protein VHE61_13265 [Opitutaceae bacterium]|nr:hypothetical protein [Opitutaceae bacterium]
MNKLIQLPLLLCGVLLLGACSTVDSRINQKSAVFNSLDPNTQATIKNGDIALGYTPDMVYMALGQPDLKRNRITSGGETETWIYRSYYDGYDGPMFVGYHRWFAPYGGFYRFYWEPAPIDYRGVPQDDIRVTFKNGRVVMIDQAKA